MYPSYKRADNYRIFISFLEIYLQRKKFKCHAWFWKFLSWVCCVKWITFKFEIVTISIQFKLILTVTAHYISSNHARAEKSALQFEEHFLLFVAVTYICLWVLRLTRMPFVRPSEDILVGQAVNEWLEHFVRSRAPWVLFPVVYMWLVLDEGVLGQDFLQVLWFIHVKSSDAFCTIPAFFHNYLSLAVIVTIISYRRPRSRMPKREISL
jgi:hypothetical protein